MSTPTPISEDGFQYYTESMNQGIDQLANGTQEIQQMLDDLKSNVELNFEGWLGKAKDEFLRVHKEVDDDLQLIAGWLNLTRFELRSIIQDAEDGDIEHAGVLGDV